MTVSRCSWRVTARDQGLEAGLFSPGEKLRPSPGAGEPPARYGRLNGIP